MRIILNINELLDKCINEKLIDLTISNVKKKGGEIAVKVKIRPVILKDELVFQVSEFIGQKVYHKNVSCNEVKKLIIKLITDVYKQAQFNMTDASAQVLSGNNGNLTIKYKKSAKQKEQKDLSHNRSKKYILKEGVPVGFLIDLGVMTKDGKIVHQKYDKYRQINRFLEFIEDILPQLDKNKEQTIIDFGCGKSYLTFAMYYYLKVLKGYNVRIIGLDLKEDVIEKCNELKKRYGYDELNFYVGDVASYNDVNSVDMVVTLHACDTATDYALAKAVKWGAKVILSVPCCQHEANSMIESELLRPVLKYGILKERISAIFTDAIRAQELEKNGYQTQILEFIDMEHTPKNLLIRAVKTAHGKENMTIKPIKTAEYKENSISKTGRIDAVISQKNDNSYMSANGNEQKESLLAMEEALNLNLTINRLLDK
jgi:SAM-dependent methyltransferase